MPKVLCVSRDSLLLETRRAVLSTRYDVAVVESMQAIERLSPASDFDVVLLCHTLGPRECMLSAEIIRKRWPEAKILALTAESEGCTPAHVDDGIAGLDGPAVMLDRIQALMPVHTSLNCASI